MKVGVVPEAPGPVRVLLVSFGFPPLNSEGGEKTKKEMPELGIEPRTLEYLWHVPPLLG